MKKIEGIRAVIFDMDGTLIDSEKLYYRFWKQATQEAGYELTHEHLLMLRSFTAPQAKPAFQKLYGEEFDFMAIRSRRRELVNQYIAAHGVEKKPGVDETLDALRKKGYRLAVATATGEDRAVPYLRDLGLLEKFDCVICASMVEHGKPSPDIYLYACEHLGEKPEDCLAVEDAPNGVLSAFRAGCKVVMIPDLSEPDEVLSTYLTAKAESMFELNEILT